MQNGVLITGRFRRWFLVAPAALAAVLFVCPAAAQENAAEAAEDPAPAAGGAKMNPPEPGPSVGAKIKPLSKKGQRGLRDRRIHKLCCHFFSMNIRRSRVPSMLLDHLP